MREGVAYEQAASEPHQPHRPGQAAPVPGRSVLGEMEAPAVEDTKFYHAGRQLLKVS